MKQSQERVVEQARKRHVVAAEEQRVKEQLRQVCNRLGARRPYRLPGFVGEGGSDELVRRTQAVG